MTDKFTPPPEKIKGLRRYTERDAKAAWLCQHFREGGDFRTAAALLEVKVTSLYSFRARDPSAFNFAPRGVPQPYGHILPPQLKFGRIKDAYLKLSEAERELIRKEAKMTGKTVAELAMTALIESLTM